MRNSADSEKQLAQNYYNSIQDIYVWWLNQKCECGQCDKNPPFSDFANQMLHICATILENIESKYADHVEGLRNHK